MRTADFTRDIKWTEGEKKAARAAFDAALARELAAIRKEVEEILKRSAEPSQVWQVLEYLSEKQREIEWTYDYRYSVLITVFARLLREGWVTEAEFEKLKPEKLELIKRIAAGLNADDT